MKTLALRRVLHENKLLPNPLLTLSMHTAKVNYCTIWWIIDSKICSLYRWMYTYWIKDIHEVICLTVGLHANQHSVCHLTIHFIVHCLSVIGAIQQMHGSSSGIWAYNPCFLYTCLHCCLQNLTLWIWILSYVKCGSV